MTLRVGFGGEYVGAGLMVGLDYLRVLLKLELFYDSVSTRDI